MPWYSPVAWRRKKKINLEMKIVSVFRYINAYLGKDGHPLLYEQDWKGNSEPKRGSHPGWY